MESKSGHYYWKCKTKTYRDLQLCNFMFDNVFILKFVNVLKDFPSGYKLCTHFHMATSAFLKLKFWFYFHENNGSETCSEDWDSVGETKTRPYRSWIELDFGRRRTCHCFRVCINQKWWLTVWHDGWRRTLESELMKVSWLSTVRDLWQRKPILEKSASCTLPLKRELTGEDTSTSMSAAGKSCHSSVDFCCVKKVVQMNDFAESGAMYILTCPL